MNAKHLLMAAALLTASAVPASAEVIGDTIVFELVNKVKIETRDTVQRIVISGTQSDPQLHYVQRISIPDTSAVRRTMKSVKNFNKISLPTKKGHESKWDLSGHLNVGLNYMTGAPDGYDFKLWPSLEWGLSMLWDYHPFGRKNVWSVGLGFAFRNYWLSNDTYLDMVNDYLTPLPYADEQENRRTSLNTMQVNIPLLYTHYFDAKARWGLTVGTLVNVNTGTAYRKYDIGDETHSVETKKIGVLPVTIEGMAIVRIPSCPDIYCKYCPMKFFKDGRGPKMNQLTIGLWW